MDSKLMRFFLLILIFLFGFSAFSDAQMLQSIVNAKATSASHSIAFTALANGTVGGSPIAGSGTYAGTAPSSISSATWGGGCSGSSTPSSFSAGAGTWSANFTVPGSSGTGCTIAITDNLTDTATSPGVTISGSGYTGPGDTVSGATYFGGVYAYTAAIAAAGTQRLVRLQRAPDSVQCDFLVAANGSVGLSTSTCNGSTQPGVTRTAFAGVDVSGTGLIFGTTLTLTGGHVNDTVYGSGITNGTWIVSGSSPTWTVNISQTVASTTITTYFPLNIATLYNQAGSGDGIGVGNVRWVDNGGPGGFPAFFYDASSHIQVQINNYNTSTGTVHWIQNPATAFNSGAVREQWAQNGSGTELSCQVYSDNNWYCGWVNGSDTRVTFAASSANYPQTWTDYFFTWSTSAGSALFKAATSIGTNGTAAVPGNLAADMYIGGNSIGADFPAYMLGFGIWPSLFSGGNITAVNSQAQTYPIGGGF